MSYLIWVNGLVHHVTSHAEDHEAHVERLIAAGHDVTTETQS